MCVGVETFVFLCFFSYSLPSLLCLPHFYLSLSIISLSLCLALCFSQGLVFGFVFRSPAVLPSGFAAVLRLLALTWWNLPEAK